MANDDLNRQFGQYTLLEKLGVGGMAIVYRAIHNKHKKEVAVKILHEHFVDDEIAIKRLEREAKITGQLKHPNIVPVLAFNVAEGRPYLVMPFYKGGTLAEYFHQPREMESEATLNILETLAGALDYAHSKGVIHRDFKLENILLSKHKKALISDFGIAQISNTTKLTATGHFVGTPYYMAPEQASADRDVIDYRADLYAFAVMAYLMLTGVFPFTSTDPFQLVIKHNTQEPPTPTLINDKLPRNIDPVLLRGLAKRPIERYQSAGDFVKALQNAFISVSPLTTIIDMERQNPMGSNMAVSFETLRESNRVDEHATRQLSDDETDSDETTQQKRRMQPAIVFAIVTLLACGLLTMLAYGTGNAGFIDSWILVDAEAAELTEEAELTEVVESTEDGTAEVVTTEQNTITPVTSVTTGNTASDTSVPATNTVRPTSIRASNTARPTNTAIPPTRTPVPATNTARPTNTAIPPTRIPPTQVPPTAVPPTQVPSVIDPVVTIISPILPGGSDDNDDDDGGCLLLIGC